MDIIEFIGGLFQSFMNPLILLFEKKEVAPFLALIVIIGAIIIFVIASYIWFVKQKPLLKTALGILSRAKDSYQFSTQVWDINTEMKKLPGINICWAEFYETLVPPKSLEELEEEYGEIEDIDDEEFAWKNTVRPYEFFSTTEAGFDTPMLRIVPNVFVGIGLTITFLGLIAALSIATENLTDDLERAIEGLLSASSAKFYTSLFALFSSILLTIYLKYIDKVRDRAFDAISKKLESIVVYLSEARIALDQVEILKNQSLQLENFNTDLAVRLGESIQTAMMPVTQKLDDMANNMGQTNIDAIREISEKVATEVQGAAGDQLTAIGDRLATLSDTLSNLSGTLQNSSNQFGSDIAETFETIKEQMTEVTDTLKANAEESSNVMAEKIEALATSLSSAAEEMKESMTDGATNLTSQLTTAIEALTTATNNSAEKMEQAVDGIKEAMENIIGNLEENADQVISEAGDKISNAGENAAEAFQNAGQELSAALQNSSNSLIEAVEILSQKLNDTQTSITALNQGMSNTNTGLNNAKTAIDDSVKNLTTASNRIQPLMEPVIRAVSELKSTSESMSGSVKRMEEELSKTADIFAKHSTRYENVDQKLAGIFTKVQTDMQNSLEKMSDFVIKIDDNFSSSVGALQEAVEELTDERKASNNQGNN